MAEAHEPRPSAPPERLWAARFRLSLSGKLLAGFIGLLILMAGMAVGATRLPLSRWAIFLSILLVGVPLGAWWISRMLRPVARVTQGVTDGIRSFRDRDFSVRLAYRPSDELGELVSLYNEVGEILQEERRGVRQRELLLRTALDRSPASLALVGPTGRIVYANQEARRTFVGGSKLEGQSFDELLEVCPEAMREILDGPSDGIFTVPSGDEEHETYHLSQRSFLLNRRPHRLLMLRRLTAELGRQEAQVWKRVIRIICHELNNSLAPVSSLVHSARKMANDPRWADRSEEVYGTIRERLDHLQRFIEGYAHFARLPQPRVEEVAWPDFLAQIRSDSPQVEVDGALPEQPGQFDPAQMRQVLLNLIKNAEEASPPGTPIRLSVRQTRAGTYLQVVDRGTGMDETTMRNALLPFYSTKQTGTGLGLPLCREILEAHGGKISLQAELEGGTRVTCWLPPRGLSRGGARSAAG